LPTLERQPAFSRVKRVAGLRWSHLCVFVGAVALAAAFYFDLAVVNWLKVNATPDMTSFMRAVSRWGDWPMHALAGLIAAGVAYALRSREWLAIFIAMLLALTAASAVNRVIKIAAGRSRPMVTTDAGWRALRWSSNYHAFPSGHTASSTGFFAVLFFARRRIGLPLLAIPLLIAFSRIYLRAHYLSDCVFAAMLGTVCAALSWRAVQKRALLLTPQSGIPNPQ
jgi:undecaprenyl-diphosphatase